MCRELADRISPQRANKCRRVLYGALSQAVRWQLIPRNPCDAVKPLKVGKAEMQLWTPEEAARFLDSARTHRLFALFYLAMSTEMRRGELLGLCWQDIGESCLYVRQSIIDQRGHIMVTTPKIEKGVRRIALSPDVAEVMRQHRELQGGEKHLLGTAWPDTGLVFTSEVGTHLHPRNFTRTWHTLQKNAEVRKVKLHDLRHLRASMATRSGVNPNVLVDRLGHARASFTLDVTPTFLKSNGQTALCLYWTFCPKASLEPQTKSL